MGLEVLVPEGFNITMIRRAFQRLRTIVRVSPCYKRRPITRSDTLTDIDTLVTVDASSAAVVISLPPVLSVPDGKRYDVKKIDSSGNTVTIDGDESETIDGSTTQVISSQYTSVTVAADHDNETWWII